MYWYSKMYGMLKKFCHSRKILIIFCFAILVGFYWRDTYSCIFKTLPKNLQNEQKIVSYKKGPVDSRKCDSYEPRNNVVFVKTHKTAGTTIQNILLRYAEKESMTVGLPAKEFRFRYAEGLKFESSFMYPPKKAINMLCHHMRFDRNQVSSVMPSNTKYLTIIRETGDLFTSFFDYFHSACPSFSLVPQTTAGFRKWLNNADRFVTKRLDRNFWWYAKNGLSFDLGFDNTRDDDMYVKEVLQEMEETYHLVLISNYFEESVILLKDLLCLSFRDIRHLRLNSRFNSSVKLDTELRNKIRKWNKLDSAIYDYFNKTFWKRVDAYGRKRMEQDVAKLRHFNKELLEACIEKDNVLNTHVQDKLSRVHSPKGVKMAGFILKASAQKNKTCQDVTKTEKNWYRYMMKKQYNVTMH